jgi:hypothetical protein
VGTLKDFTVLFEKCSDCAAGWFRMGMKLDHSPFRVKTECIGEYLDLRGRTQQGDEENCIRVSTVISALHKILLELSDQER